MSDWLLRLLTLEDLPAAARLHAACFPDRPWNAESLEESLRSPGVFGFVALHEGRPAGMALFRLAGDEAEVLTVCCAPAFRRQGVGRALLTAALSLLAGKGACRLFLEVAADNAAAQALYHRLGFTEVGRREGYYRRGAERCDALILGRALSKDEQNAV